jgi:hypothetical protein
MQESAEGIVKLQVGSPPAHPTGHGLWKTENVRKERVRGLHRKQRQPKA